jgi:hypothetical protein
MRMYETIVTRLEYVGTDAASGEPDERAATALLSFKQRRKIHIHVPENLRLEGHSIENCRDIQLDALDPAEIARPAAATADELRLVECDPIRSNHRRPVAPLPRADRDPTTFVRRIHPLVNIFTTFFAWGGSRA